MSNLPKLFNYEDKPIRVVVVDNDLWWVAKDICNALEHSNSRMALDRLDEDEKGVSTVYTPGGPQKLQVINEQGLYRLIFTSRVEKAEDFKRWLAHEVLPSIRKHGIYATDNVINQILHNPDFGIQLLTTLKEERHKRLEVEAKNQILMHVNKTYTSTEIAKELGFRSAIALNQDLAQRRIQFKQNNTWVLYSDFANRGYVDIKQEVLDNGKVIYHRRWTQLGREFLLTLYNESVQAM